MYGRVKRASGESALVHLLVFIGPAFTACGGGDNPGPTTIQPPATTQYDGVFTSGAVRGVVTLRTGDPATGSITVEDGVPVPLTGTAINGQFAMSGGGYTVSARVQESGALMGTATGSDLQAEANVGGLATIGTPGTRYCGVYTGADAGMVSVLLSGNQAVATVTGMGGGFTIEGTSSLQGVNFLLNGKEPGTNRPSTITANLQRKGDTLSGPAANSLYPSGGVTVTVTRAGCNTAIPPEPYNRFAAVIKQPGPLHRLTIIDPGGGAQVVQAQLSTREGAYATFSGFYLRTTGVFEFNPPINTQPVSIQARLTGNKFSGTISGRTHSGHQFPANSTIEGLAGTAAVPARTICGRIEGPAPGELLLVTSGTQVIGLVQFDSYPQSIGGTFGGNWIYLSGSGTYWAAQRSSASGNDSYVGTWSNTNGQVGSWSASVC